MKQTERVIEYLLKHDYITGNEARFHLSIADLPKVISDLRLKQGIPVEGEHVNGTNQFGEKTHWNRYWLPEDYKARALEARGLCQM